MNGEESVLKPREVTLMETTTTQDNKTDPYVDVPRWSEPFKVVLFKNRAGTSSTDSVPPSSVSKLVLPEQTSVNARKWCCSVTLCSFPPLAKTLCLFSALVEAQEPLGLGLESVVVVWWPRSRMEMVLTFCGEISGLVATETSGATKNVWKYSQLTLKISTSVNHLEALLIMKFIGNKYERWWFHYCSSVTSWSQHLLYEDALKLKFCYVPDVSWTPDMYRRLLVTVWMSHLTPDVLLCSVILIHRKHWFWIL